MTNTTTSLTPQQVERVLQRHFTHNRNAVINNKRYRNKSPRNKKGHSLRTRKSILRRKIRETDAHTDEGKAYIQQCYQKIAVISMKLVELGFKP